MEILKWLELYPIVKDFRILEYKTFNFGFFIKIKVILVDNSELYIREYSDIKERNYSYHWQDEYGELKIRWDNAPYHPESITYPHHKHIGQKIESSNEIIIKEVLEVINTML